MYRISVSFLYVVIAMYIVTTFLHTASTKFILVFSLIISTSQCVNKVALKFKNTACITTWVKDTLPSGQLLVMKSLKQASHCAP